MTSLNVGASAEDAVKADPVLAVDLDGTLVKTDTLYEQVIRLVFRDPFAFFGLVMALLKGRAALKAYCSERVALDPSLLPFCDGVLAIVQRYKSEGALIVLCTAADQRTADGVAEHLGLFDEVMASDGTHNLKGPAKAEALAHRFPQGFLYLGDSPEDVHVWKRSSGAILVGASRKTAAQVNVSGVPIVDHLRAPTGSAGAKLKLWLRALRAHQWTKNLLMLVPLVLAHEWTNSVVLVKTVLAFLALTAVTSATYLLNDLADLDADRSHATKRYRPLASGELAIPVAVAVAALLGGSGLASAFWIDGAFALALIAYLTLTLAYSFRLKRIPLLDTGILACLFTLRLAMGSALLESTLSVWLISFSMFFFFSLAMAKRHAEIARAMRKSGNALASRGYQVDDWPLTLGLGLASGFGSLIILTFYLVFEAFDRIGYTRPEFLWLIMPIVGAWLLRVWFLTHRGRMNDDPIRFAIKDPPSLALGLCVGLSFAVAL